MNSLKLVTFIIGADYLTVLTYVNNCLGVSQFTAQLHGEGNQKEAQF